MLFSTILFATVASFLVHSAQRKVVSCPVCSQIALDNFTTKNRNLLGGYASDDGTMNLFKVENQKLTLQKKVGVGSYYYSKIMCLQDLGSNQGLELEMTIPAGASFSIAFRIYKVGQVCGTGSYEALYKNSKSLGITSLGSRMNVRIPFSAFPGFNGSKIHALDFGSFSVDSADYVFENLRFYCDGTCASASSSTTSQSSTPASTATMISQTTLPTITTSLPTVPATSTTLNGTTTTAATATSSPTTGSCSQDLIVDDFAHSSRYSILHYNSLNPPGATSDDNSMNSLSIGNYTLRLNPKSGSYFFTQTYCPSFDLSNYEGLYFDYFGPATSSFNIGFQYYDTECYTGSWKVVFVKVSNFLDRNMVKIPFSAVTGFNKRKPHGIIFRDFISTGQDHLLGPIRFYCSGSLFQQLQDPSETSLPNNTAPASPYPVGTLPSLMISDFSSTKAVNRNDLGFYQGFSGMSVSLVGADAILTPSAQEAIFYTTIAGSCGSLSAYRNSYLELNITDLPTGQDFDVLLNQHNSNCDESKRFPVTWSQVQLSRYINAARTRAYIPIIDLATGINLDKISSIAFKYFRSFATIKIDSLRIVPSLPASWVLPAVFPQSPLYFACKTPNDIALGIDNGLPRLTQQVLQILRDEQVKATFFVLGTPLNDDSNNLTVAYNSAIAEGHTIGHHSNSHPYFNTLANWQVDEEIDQAMTTIQNKFSVRPSLFRPPFGNIGNDI